MVYSVVIPVLIFAWVVTMAFLCDQASIKKDLIIKWEHIEEVYGTYRRGQQRTYWLKLPITGHILDNHGRRKEEGGFIENLFKGYGGLTPEQIQQEFFECLLPPDFLLKERKFKRVLIPELSFHKGEIING